MSSAHVVAAANRRAAAACSRYHSASSWRRSSIHAAVDPGAGGMAPPSDTLAVRWDSAWARRSRASVVRWSPTLVSCERIVLFQVDVNTSASGPIHTTDRTRAVMVDSAVIRERPALSNVTAS